jgi:hypothetical protein
MHPGLQGREAFFALKQRTKPRKARFRLWRIVLQAMLRIAPVKSPQPECAQILFLNSLFDAAYCRAGLIVV